MLPLLASMLPTGLVGSGLTVNELWLTLKRDARHLTKEDRFLVKASVEVLLSKASLAERAERAFGSNVRWDLVERAPATEALYVLSAVRTAKDMLSLNADAATVSAALLSQVLGERSPTWPASRLPPLFMAEVSQLLDQQRRMRDVGAAAADLDDAQAEAVRNVLSRGIVAEAKARAQQERELDSPIPPAPGTGAAAAAAAQPAGTAIVIDEATGGAEVAPHVGVEASGAAGEIAGEAVAGGAPSSDEDAVDLAHTRGGSTPTHGPGAAHGLSEGVGQQVGGAVGGDGASLASLPTAAASVTDDDGGEVETGVSSSLVLARPESQGSSLDPRSLLVLLGGALLALRASDALPSAQRHARALESVQLFAPLAHSLGLGGGPFAELESLSYASLFPESLRRLRGWYLRAWPDADTLVPELCASLEARLREAPSLGGLLGTLTISGRVKSVTSTFRKLLRDNVGGSEGENVRDALALRVILTPAPQAAEQLGSMMRRPSALSAAEVEALVCFGVHREMLRLWPEEPGRFKDFITQPKPNGYQSLHTNVRLADGRTIEVQIRSRQMHERAEYGSASHDAYRAAQLGAGESTSAVAPLLRGGSPAKLLPPAATSGVAVPTSSAQRSRTSTTRRRSLAAPAREACAMEAAAAIVTSELLGP